MQLSCAYRGTRAALVLGLAVSAAFVSSAARADTCQSAVDQAESFWRTLSMAAPDKPTQAHVPESHAHGETVDGALYTYLADQLRFAAASCRDGKDAQARTALTAFNKALPPHSVAAKG